MHLLLTIKQNKMKKFLLVSFSMLLSLSAFAAEWVRPVPTASTFAFDTEYYLFNKEAGVFFTEGNDWGTRASYADTGLKVKFTQYIVEGEEWDGKTILFNDSSLAKSSWKLTFIDAEQAAYVDLGSQANYFWEMKDMGDNTYRIFGGALNPTFNCTTYEDCYFGINPAEAKTVIFPLLDVTLVEGAQVDWQFISPENYEAFLPLMATYKKALELGGLIEEAESYELDVNDEKAVFANTSSTIEQLQAAVDSVTGKINKYKESHATPENPQDVTDSFLENSTFNSTSSPWITTTGAQNTGIATNKCDGTYSYDGFWENWNGSPYKGKMYIKLEGMPAGVYNVYMAAFTNGGGKAYVYGNNFSTEVTSTEMQPYNVYTLVTADTLELGLNQPAATGNWMGIDNVKLTYYGNSVASYVYMINEAHNAAPDFEAEGVYVQKSALQTYKDVYQSAISKTEIADLQVAVVEHFNALQVMLANYNAYQKYQQVIAEVEKAFNEEDLNGEAAEELGDYLISYEDEILIPGLMSTEEITAEGERIKELLATARKQSVSEGQDVTALLTNPNFTDGTNGWTWDTSLGSPAKGGDSANPNIERWNENFNFWQDVEVPNGVYKLQVQAFYRTADNETNRSEFEAGTDDIRTFIYLNNAQKAVVNVMTGKTTDTEVYPNAYTYTEGEDLYYVPNSMTDFSHACDNGLYENEVFGVVTDGKMRVGIRSLDGSIGNRWSIWDNFRIQYWGKNAEILTSVLTELIAQCQETLDEEPIMGTAEKESFQKAINDASESLLKTGDDMFKAYLALLDAQSSANNNIEAYSKLQTSFDDLVAAIEEYQETASQEALDNASQLMEEVGDAIDGGSYTTEEANAKITDIAAAITDLKVPATPATDDNPVDMTNLINNPTFDDANLSGWLGTAWGRGGTVADGAEQYNKKFDTYQEIVGLKQGTYAVGVQAFYRRGSSDNDYSIYTSENPHSADNVVVYAVGDSAEWQTPLCAPSSEILSEDQLPEGVVAGNCSVVGGAGNYIPNTMLAADGWFNQLDKYHNTVYVNVGADKTLRLGAKFVGESTLSMDWSLFDNWTLTYFGKDSKHNPVTGINDVQTVETITVKGIFNLAGQKLAAPQKGINIINGKKVLVK